MRDAGATVMPFDLDQTKHYFDKNDTGGVQTVVALDPSDAEQVRLVREHLQEIQTEFSAGRFDDPTAIHGADMPGVNALSEGAARLEITYADVDGGGEITYRTDDDQLVTALHDWFDAQLSDHGTDAMSGMPGHDMTPEMWQQHHPGESYPGTTDAP
ncbi:MAG: aspartate carbamoyltransferase [Actinobacteria bacterium]|nr:aspartate carbamoyltransferase [Actinomycetota bacterium]